MNSSPARPSIWSGNNRSVPARQPLSSAFEFVHAMAMEYGRAMAAARRYEQLKYRPKACGKRTSEPARQVFLEFYSGV